MKKENKKAIIKFSILLIACTLLGGLVGSFSFKMSIKLADVPNVFNFFVLSNALQISIIYSTIMVFIIVLTAAYVLYCIKYTKNNYANLIEEDDDTGLHILDNKLSLNLWLTNAVIILEFLFISVMFFIFNNNLEEKNIGIYIYTIIVFIVGSFAAFMLQQKIINCLRLINPEKKGSIYEVNFHKKWEESCDEAELFIIYKAAYKAYRIVTILCIFLWLIFFTIGMITGTGFLTIITILIIWATLTSVYSYYSTKYSN